VASKVWSWWTLYLRGNKLVFPYNILPIRKIFHSLKDFQGNLL